MVFLRWLLFETRLGELVLVLLERQGLAVVCSDWLGTQRSGKPIVSAISSTVALRPNLVSISAAVCRH